MMQQQMLNQGLNAAGGPALGGQMNMGMQMGNPGAQNLQTQMNNPAMMGAGNMSGMGNMPPQQMGGNFQTSIPGGPGMQHQQMPGGMEKKAPIKIQLSNKEKGYYSNLLMQADPNQTNKVGGQVGVAFFKRSGLPVDLLKNFWLLAARTTPEYLTRDEFYIALRLIAYAQHGIKPNEESLQFNIDVDLPKFDPAPLALTSSEQVREKPEIRAEEIAASLPDLDSLDLNQFNNISSLIPSVNQVQQQKVMNQAQQQMMKQQQMMHQQVLERAKQSPWFIQPEEKERYLKIFAQVDKENMGFLSSEKVRGLFTQTQMDQASQDQVWNLVNPDNKERFDKPLFVVTIHYLYKKKQGSELPPRLPEESLLSVDPETYFKNFQQRMMQQQSNPQMMQMQNKQQQMQQPMQQQQVQQQQMPKPQNQVPQQQQQIQPQNIPQPQPQSIDLLGQGPQAQQSQQVNIQPQNLNSILNQNQDRQSIPNIGNISVNLQGSGQKKSVNFIDISPDKSSLKLQPGFQNPIMQQQISVNSQSMHQNGIKSQQSSPRQQLPPPIKLDPGKVQIRKEEIQFMKNLYMQDQAQYHEIQNENMKIIQQMDELDREFQAIQRNLEIQRQLLMTERNRSSEAKITLDQKQQEVNYAKEQLESVMQERLSVLSATHNQPAASTSPQQQSFNHGGYSQPDDLSRKDSYSNNNYAGYNQSNATHNDYNQTQNNGYDYQDTTYNGAAAQSSQNYYQDNSYGAQDQYNNQHTSSNHYDYNNQSQSYDQYGASASYSQQPASTQPASTANNNFGATTGFGARFDFDNFDSDSQLNQSVIQNSAGGGQDAFTANDFGSKFDFN
eukprot:403376681